MEKTGLLTTNHYVRVTPKLIRELPRPGEKVLTPFREVDLAIRRLATYGMASNALEPTLIDDLYQDIDFASVDGFEDLPDPKAYLFLPTDRGLISLDDKRGYRELIRSNALPPGSIRRIGGVLNFVYLIEYDERGKTRKVVAKTFQNWYGLKWIPLSIWTVGSQNFDIMGERRLTNEYKMNRSLRSKGLNAPEILHVSIPKRTIIEEFISGTGFDEIAKRCLNSGNGDLCAEIMKLGEEISRVHATGVSLGDSKPDNAILDGSGKIWFVDLEQASQGGSPAWDLAEFLYYCGHYTLRWGRMKPLTRAFLDGYLKIGEKKVVREISSSKYKRIFGVLTAPHILMGISKVSRSYIS
jgi:tRNA A-37 threonylcarbamoyl transferase component Bud32